MSELPKGWVEATVGDTGRYINGFAFKPSHWGETGRPIIRIQNLTDPEKPINRTHLEVGDDLVVRTGDILVSWSATLDAFIWSDEEAVLNQHIFRVVPDSGFVDHRYLFYLLKLLIAEMVKSRHMHGSTMKHINRGPFLAYPAPIAPKLEQQRIADEIETQFTRLDAATAALKRVQANLKRYRASVLKAACEGRLVPTEAELARKEGRDYEPADKLLQRILRERRARWEADTLAKMQASGTPPKDNHWKQNYKEPSPPDTTNLPELPEGWCWASLDQLAVIVRNGISMKPNLEEGLPILRISAVRAMSVNLEDVRFLPDNPEFRQYALSENDLLFVRYNGNPDISGRCGRVGVIDGTVVHPDKLIRVDLCFKRELSGWVEIVTNFGLSRRHLELKTRTTAGQSGVSGEDIKAIPIPLCPVSEAVRIVAESDRLLSNQEALFSEIKRNEVRSASLRQSVLRAAFTGQLVPQDPTDEPASKLLERIRAGRVESSKKTVARKAAKKRGKR